MMDAKSWISTDEPAKDMLARVFAHGLLSSHLLPPLHRVSLRLGNVLELVGPSPSAKTHLLNEVAVNCILPVEWKGVHYGGLGRGVVYIDLDCRFDILRLSELLRRRIMDSTKGSCNEVNWEPLDANEGTNDPRNELNAHYDDELFAECMRRFLYIRCYDSFELLSTLKTLKYHLKNEKETHGLIVNFLMIDSIGAFYWVDRASMSLPLGGDIRKGISVQCVLDAVTTEIRKLLMQYPMLVIATKATILVNRFSANEAKGDLGKRAAPDTSQSIKVTNNSQLVRYREYMPSVWQSLVTHRVLLQASDNSCSSSGHQSDTFYISEWLLPALNILDKFIVRDAGVINIS